MQALLILAICATSGPEFCTTEPRARVAGTTTGLVAPRRPVETPARAVNSPTRVESIDTAGGQLVTVFQQSRSGKEYPVLSYFKDTLGDQEAANDRLRYVWLLNHKKPSPVRHVLAAIPFFYIRTPSKPAPAGTLPRPILDLTKPAGNTYRGIARTVGQVRFLDNLGGVVRSSTRSYRSNFEEQQAIRIAEAASALEDPRIGGMARTDLQAVRSRMLLSTQLLGGLVSDKGLPMVHEKELTRREEMRGQNWELIRRESEDNGLYFQPLRLAGGPESHGIVWVARNDLNRYIYRPYNGRFLKVPNPWTDRGLRRWKGYTEKRVIDGQESEMIPLALYSFDYPKVPYLLVAMRNPYGPRYREVLRRAASDSMVGIWGFSRFTNWYAMAGIATWDFVRGRHGATNNRAWRTRSYAEFKHRLSIDESLAPGLRKELSRQINRLAVNPLDEATEVERKTAEVQYRALVAWARSSKGLVRKIEKDRSEELAMYRRNPARRTLAQTARWLSFGLYRPQAGWTIETLAELDMHRRLIHAENQRLKPAGGETFSAEDDLND